MKPLLIFISLLIITSCTSQNKSAMEKHAYTNKLIKESSPYLLQHAHNPVDWEAWGDEAIDKAKKENKLMIVSIGYAACHWCHVMEHESFEDTIVASVMNKNYVNIKIDREERPDIDQVYMSAIQLMTGSGGWPLNVITLPDGRPVWGGTYFKKGDWIDALKKINELHQKQPEKLVEYAEKLQKGIQQIDLIEPNKDAINFDSKFIETAVSEWSTSFDKKQGGTKRVPKFMMPNNYHFLLRYAKQANDKELMEYVTTTLNKISHGGVYDHIGGGFSRYSTDGKWHVPHFEKMLYDNAQLVSLYADAYLINKDPWYKDVVYETLDFVSRDLMGTDGVFYSSIDADSNTPQGELEEGAFYVWTKEELKTAIGNDYDLFANYYNVNSYGHWEKNHYVLIKSQSDAVFCKVNDITQEDLNLKVKGWKKTLFDNRENRNKPRLDDKTLTSWNALMLKGYTDAYRVFKDPAFLKIALKNAIFIKEKQIKKDGSLYHNYKNEKSSINGYLEDYAMVIEAYIALYQNTFDQEWLYLADQLTSYTIKHFYDETKKIFYFTSDQDTKLITRTIESTDNVIPASNSVMAKNLYLLSHYFDNKSYLAINESMLHNIKPQIAGYPSGYSNWLDLMLNYSYDFYEIAITGPNADSKLKELNNTYIPNKLLAGSTSTSESPLLRNRYVEDKTLIYVCINNACKYPVENTNEVLNLIMPKTIKKTN